MSLDVIFTSQDIKDGFGTEVWLTLSSQQLIYSYSVRLIIMCAVAYAKGTEEKNQNKNCRPRIVKLRLFFFCYLPFLTDPSRQL